MSLLKLRGGLTPSTKELMAPIDDRLSTGERIIYRATCHWAVLLGPGLVIIIGGLALKSQGYHAMTLIAFGFLWGLVSYVSLSKSEIGLTSARLLVDAGFPVRRFHDIPLDKIATVDYYQPTLGSMLNFGKIIVVYEGKRKCVVRFVSGPAELVREIRREILSGEQPLTAD